MPAANVEHNAAIHRLEEQKKEATTRENNLFEEVSHLRAKLGSASAKLESVQSDLKLAKVEVKAQRSRAKKKKACGEQDKEGL